MKKARHLFKNQTKKLNSNYYTPVFLGCLFLVIILVSVIILSNSFEKYVEQSGNAQMMELTEQIKCLYDLQLEIACDKLEHIRSYITMADDTVNIDEFDKFFYSFQQGDTYEVIFGNDYGEICDEKGTPYELMIQPQTLSRLHLNKTAAQEISYFDSDSNLDSASENRTIQKKYFIGLPCSKFTVNGTEYEWIGALYDISSIDTILSESSYKDHAYMFLMNENGILNYTNQLAQTQSQSLPQNDYLYNQDLTYYLVKNGYISSEDYLELCSSLSQKKNDSTLYESPKGNFYLSFSTLKTTDDILLLIVPKNVVNESFLTYQSFLALTIFLDGAFITVLAAIFGYSIIRRKNSRKLEQCKQEYEEIVELKENQAKEDTRYRDAFLEQLVHDIRNPLGAMTGFTDLLGNDPEIKGKSRDYVNKLKSATSRLAVLINDIVDIRMIESKEITLKEECVNLNQILTQTETIIREYTSRHRQTFQIRIQNLSHNQVRCDGERLRQILLNLLSYSAKYTPDEGTVRFGLSEVPCDDKDCSRYRFTVGNDGHDMQPEVLGYFSNTPEKVNDSLFKRIQGMGFELTITQVIVKLMGARLNAFCEPGKGNCIILTMDLHHDTLQQSDRKRIHHEDPEYKSVFLAEANSDSDCDSDSKPQPKAYTKKSLKEMYFLCADDNDANAEMLHDTLELYGARCTMVSDGIALVNEFNKDDSGKYDAILLDIRMPGMNGIEAAKAIRTGDNLNGKTIPIIAVTANESYEEHKKCKEAGMNGFLLKPFEMEELEELIRSISSK